MKPGILVGLLLLALTLESTTAATTSLRRIFKSHNIDLEVVGIDDPPTSDAYHLEEEEEDTSFLETGAHKKRTNWKLIMMTSATDNQFAYNARHWRSGSAVSGTMIKSKEYSRTAFKQMRICVTSKKNCYQYKGTRVWSSAKQLFSSSWQRVDINQKKFDKVFGRRTNKNTDCGMIRWGFNVQCKHSKARIGYCSNAQVETGCKSQYGSRGVSYARYGAYLGCFRDQGKRDLPWMPGWWFQKSNCHWWAWRWRKPYYALQWWGHCFVGWRYGKYGKANNCNTPCRWNRRQTCGGAWANSVYVRDTNEDSGALGVGLYTNAGGKRMEAAENLDAGWTSGIERRYNGAVLQRKKVYLYVLEHKLCIKNNGGCDGNSKCVNTHNGVICGPCPRGYTGNGYDGCQDIDECKQTDACDVLTKCKNSQGTFSCSPCPDGYTGNGKTGCKDINECHENNGKCDSRTRCTNKAGSRDCSDCPEGWMGNGASPCVDKNECWAPKSPCDPATKCVNKDGGYKCTDCPKGYVGTGEMGCEDIDECSHHKGLCDPLTTCSNTKGSFDCGACPDGYKGSGKEGCVDVDECKRHNGGCDPASMCINTRGSRTCGPCPNGYSGDGIAGCTDIDECEVNNGVCDENVECINTIGSRECGRCPKGWSGSGYSKCTKVIDDSIMPFEKLNDMVDRVVKKTTDGANKLRKEKYEETALKKMQKDRKEQEDARLHRLQAEQLKLKRDTEAEMQKREEERKAEEELAAHEADMVAKEKVRLLKEKAANAVKHIYQNVLDEQAPADDVAAVPNL